MAELTFYYWPIRARNWLVLITASVADVSVHWERVNQDTPWKEWAPFGQLPLLKRKVPGSEEVEVLAQSLTIARYLARRGGILGDNDWEQARSDEFVQAWEDIHIQFARANTDANRKAAMDALFNEKLPAKLKQFENLLRGETFFADGKIRLGDLAIFAGLDLIVPLQPDVLDQTPKLKAFYEKIGAHPKVKAVTQLEGLSSWFKRE
eukprot:TRINITY_DN1274_c0_g1_i1.p1 TRINITY_DN1274_c0_g1~~TRINITY_DN1274_c0_g1_i1.p1  ORF type:complete len:207 (-),score=43.86 TRINITY_DN1274_c0_g1_i1:26-646(-)